MALRLPGQIEHSDSEKEVEAEYDDAPEEGELLVQHGEDGIGVLFWQKRVALLRALKEASPVTEPDPTAIFDWISW